MKKYILFFIAILLFTTSVKADELYKARLHKITDGDTIQVYIDNELHKLRFLNIDCYETSNNPRAKLQATYYHKSIGEILRLGNESKTILTNLLNQHKDNLYVDLQDKDRFQRDLAIIYIGKDKEINVNDFMMSDGKCEKYVSSKEMKGF